MKKILHAIWAKSPREGETVYHPLILHLLDVAAAADMILAREPESTRQRLASILGLPWEDARPWLLLVITHNPAKTSKPTGI